MISGKSIPPKPMIGYVNINSLKNKIEALQEICKKVQIDIFCIGETELDFSFSDSLFRIDGYQYPPFRRGRDNRVGGKITYAREGLPQNRSKNLETEISEAILLDLNISNKNKVIDFTCRLPNNRLLNNRIYININILSNGLKTSKHLKGFSDMFPLTYIANTATGSKSAPGTPLDIMLTNKPNYFTYTCAVTTYLSDCHKLYHLALGHTLSGYHQNK